MVYIWTVILLGVVDECACLRGPSYYFWTDCGGGFVIGVFLSKMAAYCEADPGG